MQRRHRALGARIHFIENDDSTHSYEALAQKLAWRRSPDETGRYLNVYIELNNTCNLKCVMCGFSDDRTDALPRNHMPAWLFESIARQIFPVTTFLQMSNMTEPFMTPDFLERLQLVGKHRVPFCLVVTNGTLLTPRGIERVLDAGITSLAFSIDGGTKELYEAIRVGAQFDVVMKNIERFKRRRSERGLALPKLRINHVLMRQNVDHFGDFLTLLASIRPDEVDIRIIQPTSYTIGAECYEEAFLEKLRRLPPLLAECCDRHGIHDCGFIRDRPNRIEVFDPSGRRVTCRRPWDTVSIHANGDVQPCITWTRPPLGNLAKQSFEEIWAGPEAQTIRHEFETMAPGVDCQHCWIKKTAQPPEYDDFYFKLLSKNDEWMLRR